MSLPVRLPVGIVSIYNASSINGLAPFDPEFNFGVVDQTYSQVPGIVTNGQTVMYNKENSIQIAYQGITYYLVDEKKITLVENPLT